MKNLSRAYLATYNVLQMVGWSSILTKLAKGNVSLDAIYPTVYLFQTLAILEVINAVFGIVRASPTATAIQIFSRLQVLFFHFNISDCQNSSGNWWMLWAWATVEVIRYPFLLLNLFGKAEGFIVWLRYSAFYVLYPIGVYGEMLVLYSAIEQVEREQFLSISMPNALNFEFSAANYLRFLVYLAYIPGLYLQYTHMISLRRKVLGTGTPPKKREE